jgi:hypothetical protein
MPGGFVHELRSFTEIMEVTKLMWDLGVSTLDGLAEGRLSSTQDCHNRHGQRVFDLVEERRHVMLRGGQEARGAEHLAGETVA